MQVFRSMSIKLKTSLVLSILLIAVFGMVGWISISISAQENRQTSILYMESLSQAYSNRADALLEKPLDAARTLAQIMGARFELEPELRRPLYLHMLRQVAERNEDFLGVWTLWEPDALSDGDASFANATEMGSDSLGRFAPSLYRRADGGVDLDVAEAGSLYAVAYYRVPLESGRDYVSEPHLSEIGGQDIFMISLVAPIMSGTEALGVVGVDIAVDTLHQELGGVRLYEEGFGRLISPEGAVIVHPFPDRVGRTAPEWNDPDTPALLASLERGEIFTQEFMSLATGEMTIKSFVPLFVGNYARPLVYGTVVSPDEVFASVARITSLTIPVMVLGLIAMVMAVFFLIRIQLRQLDVTRAVLRDIAEGSGDLTKRLTVSGEDEVGRLSRFFNTFVEKLHGIIVSIRGAVRTLEEVGQGLSANMEQTHASIEEIGANIEMVRDRYRRQTASIQTVSSTVEQITGNIDSLNRVIREQNDSLEESSSAVEEMVANVQSVTSNVDTSRSSFEALERVSEDGYQNLVLVTDIIKEISQQSQGLGEANDIITGIAAQTNLLAMNAAIEAAHAGEAGRGFAVVSDEIRKLAENAAEQSDTIGSMLRSLQQRIETVVETANLSGHSFEEIRSAVTQVSQIQDQISDALAEQSKGGSLVLNSLETLRRISDEVSSGSQEMQVGSSAILSEVHNLVELASEVDSSMEEITRGTGEIRGAVHAVVELSQRNNEGIGGVQEQIERFVVNEE
ncbi:MAG: methyl-accepting chemotaxis protein [Spirochaetaceae bacterium]|nr:MAG: methyl-accepting chemotaxis protein [Spirochaetaceae bacterium]